MAEYIKRWLSLEDQISKLTARGVEVPDLQRGTQLLQAVGYYRLTGYLYPFRKSETGTDGSANVCSTTTGKAHRSMMPRP